MANHCMEEYLPVLAMVGLQFSFAATAISSKAAITQGTSPMVFITYRQIAAALFLVPTTLIARRGKTSGVALGMKGFGLVFVAALIGVTFSQAFYYQGLKMASATAASAVCNTVPAITFLIAASVGLEKVQIRSPRSIAKIFGTIICVGGAVSMALFKGQKLLNMETRTLDEDWIIGCLLIFGSNCCWSVWLILQVPICKSYLDPLSFSTWMCFLGSFQSAILTFLLESDLKAWKINSYSVLVCAAYAGIIGSGVTYYMQSWCISKKGPVLTATFNPLGTVIVTIAASILLQEELYIGSLMGAVVVVVGLYIVLWGKAGDFGTQRESHIDVDNKRITISVDEPGKSCHGDLKKPLLVN